MVKGSEIDAVLAVPRASESGSRAALRGPGGSAEGRRAQAQGRITSRRWPALPLPGWGSLSVLC